MAKKEKPGSPRHGHQRKTGSAELDALVNAVMTYPETREQKIRDLKRAIANGEYGPTDRQIANAILADLRRGGD